MPAKGMRFSPYILYIKLLTVMRKNAILLSLLIAPSIVLKAQTADSLGVEKLHEAVVSGVRVSKNAPFAVANITKSKLESFTSSAQELPFLFSMTPGVIAWSENGVGSGTSYMRIRGAGDSRINVTIDGMPLNSPEDQCVFWANMNSYSALLGSVQIQRGVGSSSNGDGAFGGSVSLQSKAPSYTPYAELRTSYGSYNTYNTGLSLSTGLMREHLILDAAFHTSGTDGYIHGTAGNSGSWYGGITYIARNFVIRYKNIGNFEHTGQAWNGVTAGNDDLSLMDGTYGESTGIRTYADLHRAGLGRYNSLYERLVFDSDNYCFAKDAEGNFLTERYSTKDGRLWPRTTDNFTQDHNILSASWEISPYLSTNLSLRYTWGYGYYEEFRPNNKLSKFGLAQFTDGSGSKVKRSDFVRQKGLSQHTGGAAWNIKWVKDRWDITAGANAQIFGGNHFGYLTYVSNDALEEKILKNGKYTYYDSDARKDDYSLFAKADVALGKGFRAFADLQYRHVKYTTDGINDKFIDNGDGSYSNQALNIDAKYNFFNPKAGFSYTQGQHKTYASVALAHREPERNNFTDNGSYPAPRAESVIDYELGYNYSGRCFRAGANLYYMDYHDQFVQTGAVSDIGEALTTNIASSFRTGVELTAALDLSSFLTLEANAALSRNIIRDFDEIVEDWDNGSREVHYDHSTLAFSPSAILNGFIDFHYKDAKIVWHTSYVGRQYLDNTQCVERSLPAYSSSNLNASYTFHFAKAIKSLELGLRFANIFNSHYASSAWVYSAIYESGGHSNDNRYYQIGFIPMAGFTAMGNICIKF